MSNFFSNVSFNREVRNPKRRLKITSVTAVSVETDWNDNITQKAIAVEKSPKIKNLSASLTSFTDAPQL